MPSPITIARYGEATRVRDVIVCASSDVDVSDEEFQDHPPIGSPRSFFEKAIPEVDLGEAITLARLPDEEAQMVMTACTPRGLNFDPARQFGQVYSFVREGSIDDFRANPFGFDEVDGKLRDALMFSRLIRDNGFSLQYAARVVDRVGTKPMVAYPMGIQGKAAHRLRRDRESLDGPEAEELAALLDAYWSRDMSGRVERATWRCEYATWTPWADPMLPIIVSGLEALLKVGRRDLTTQFCTRAPALAADLGVEGVDADLCADLYDGRSDWTHGSHVALFAGPATLTDEGEGVRRKIAKLQALLRAAIRLAVEDPGFAAIFDDEALIDEHWPT